jgi:hypothetical protein
MAAPHRRLVWQHERRLRRRLYRWFGGTGPFAEQDAVDAYRPRDVFDLLLAHVLESSKMLGIRPNDRL